MHQAFAKWFRPGQKVVVRYDWRPLPPPGMPRRSVYRHPMPPGTEGTIYQELRDREPSAPPEKGSVLVRFDTRPGLQSHVLEVPLDALAPASLLERLAWEAHDPTQDG